MLEHVIEIGSQELSSTIIIIIILVKSFMEFDTRSSFLERDTFHGSLAMLTVQFISCPIFFAQLKHSINPQLGASQHHF